MTDGSKTRIGFLPRAMPSLRNLAISVLRKNGQADTVAALRHTNRDYRGPLTALGLT
ncbi:hypothetical protein OG863_40215 [Streptomyces decoyicus]|uniref:Uncharacterized protein n=1 Tax=Streptomyces decoyicus TaxID=249567 RepID=A0ABZ1FTE0_9ACTN|nr:hypothetical protein [Streptomyces decoyicus]WSB73670.1 hypothetical protein OG863_40215 [Streptomyces decoyicus]